MGLSFTRVYHLLIIGLMTCILIFPVSRASAQCDSLSTVFNGTTTCGGGFMFNLRALNQDLEIQYFSTLFAVTGSQPASVYYKSGSYATDANNPTAWTLLGSTTVNVASIASPTLVDVGNTLKIDMGQIYGIFIMFNARYGSSANVFTNSDLELTSGMGHCTAWDACCDPRTFNGRVYYCPAIKVPNDIGVSAIDSPKNFCAGVHNVVATIKNFGTNQVTTATVNWSVNGLVQTPVSFSGLLDTMGGTGNNTAQVLLGPWTFAANQNYNIKVWTSNPNGVADTVNRNDSVTVTLGSAIQGTLTLGGVGADFASFTALADKLNSSGICGPVIVNVNPAAGPYTEQFLLGSVQGSSATNTITINGNGASIEFASTTSTSRGTIMLEGASYLTIDSLRIVASTGTYGYGIHILPASEHITIRNCEVISSTTSTSTFFGGIIASGSATSPTTTGNTVNNLTIQGCKIQGGYYGITLMGSPAPSQISGNKIVNNVVEDFYFYGMYIYGNDGVLVEGNDVSRPTRTTLTTFYGIYLVTGNLNALVSKNRIHTPAGSSTTNSSTVYPIFITGSSTPVGSENRIQNNLLFNLNNNGTTYCIYNSSSSGCLIYHNTIVVDNTTATGGAVRGFFQAGTVDNVDFRNNVIFITRGGTGIKHGIYLSPGGVTSDNNVIHLNSAGTGAQYVGFSGTAQTTLADWQNQGFDLFSVASDPIFDDPSNGDYTVTTQAASNIGVQVGVVDDILDRTRCSKPDPGAFENRLYIAFNDVGVIAIDSPGVFCGGVQPIVATIQNFGSNIINSVVVEWSINGVAQQAVVWSTPMDSSCGSGFTSYQVPLGTFNFQPGVVYSVSVWTSNPNGIADTVPSNDTLVRIVRSSLGGTLTIGGTSPDFATFTDAVDALKAFGVCTPVTFNVRPGTYTEQISIPNILGSSNVNTINFQSENQDSLAVELEYGATGTADNYVVELTGSSYITFRKMTIRALGSTYAIVFNISGSASHITVENCHIRGVENATTSTFTSLVFTPTTSTEEYITFRNNFMQGGSYGFYLYGTTALRAKGHVIENNVVNTHMRGVQFINGEQIKIHGNRFSSGVYSSYNTYYGIYLSSVLEANVITANVINSGTGSYGVWLAGCNATPGNPGLIANNFIHVGGSVTAYGVYLSGTTQNYDIVFNSVHITSGSATAGRALSMLNTTGSNIRVINNILYNSGVGYAIYVSAQAALVESDYNNLIVNGSTLGFWGSNQSTLANWQAASGKDSNSLSVDPGFYSPTDLHVSSSILKNTGIPFPGVTTDIDGDQRDSLNPDIGADEFVVLVNDLVMLGFVSPAMFGCDYLDSTEVTIMIYNNGNEPQTNFEVAFRIFNIVPAVETVTDTIYPGDTLFYTFNLKVFIGVPSLYSFGAWVTNTGDQIRHNDTLQIHPVVVVDPVNQLPFIESFNVGVGGSVVRMYNDPLTDGEDWQFGASAQGISNDNTTGSGYFAFSDNRAPHSSTINLLTPCINLANVPNPHMEFYMWNASATIVLHIDVYHDGEWIMDYVPVFGNQNIAAWVFKEVNLSQFAGDVIKVRFRAEEIGTATTPDLGIDDIKIYNLPPVNVAVVSAEQPNSGCGLSDIEQISVTLEQLGFDALYPGDQVMMSFQVNGGPVTTETYVASDTLRQNDLFTYLFLTPADLSQAGEYTIRVWSSHPDDDDFSNDTLVFIVDHVPTISNFPYLQDFSTGRGGWISGGANSSWEFGEPNGNIINIASKGDNVWGTGYLRSIYNNNEQSYVISPCFDFSGLLRPQINLDVWYDAQTNADGAVIQYSLDDGQNWVRLGSVGDGINWYNYSNISGAPGGQGQAWSGYLTIGSQFWLSSKLNMPFLGGLPSVRFRIVFGSNATINAYDGFAFDNIVIGEAPFIALPDTIFDCGYAVIDPGTTIGTFNWSTGERTPEVLIINKDPFNMSQLVTLHYEDVNGLYHRDTVLVLLEPGPYVDLGGDRLICGEDELVLDAGNPGMSYLWDNGSQDRYRTVTGDGTYNVTVFSANNCVKTDEVELTFQPYPVADFSLLRPGATHLYKMSNASIGAGSYLWDFGDGIYSTLAEPEHFYPVPGVYTVKLIVTNECGSDTMVTSINVDFGVGLDPQDGKAAITVYPNPSAGNITLSWENPSVSEAKLVIVDALGRAVWTETVYPGLGSLWQKSWNLPVADGIYRVLVYTNGMVAVKELVITR